jgi:hypothetical protein
VVGELARERADEEFLRVPWPRFLQVQQEYLGWREFYFWVRTLVEHAGRVPPEHLSLVEERCPDVFSISSKVQRPTGDAGQLMKRFAQWIDDEVAGAAGAEGWLNALRFYSVRHPRDLQAAGYYLDCADRWSVERTPRYPHFKSWLKAAAEFDPSPQLLPEHRPAWKAVFRVKPKRLADAVQRYLDLEVFAYWARTALELPRSEMPDNVKAKLDDRCPGFLEDDAKFPHDNFAGIPNSWFRLIQWIETRHFREALEGDWFDAIQLHVGVHPCHIRVFQFWLAWSSRYPAVHPQPYLPFQGWRSQLDRFTDPEGRTLQL